MHSILFYGCRVLSEWKAFIDSFFQKVLTFYLPFLALLILLKELRVMPFLGQ